MKTLTLLQDHYARTKFPYLDGLKLIQMGGDREEIKELIKQKKIRLRRGIKGENTLIEIIL